MTAEPLTVRREIDWVRVIVYTLACCFVLALLLFIFPVGPTHVENRRAKARVGNIYIVSSVKAFRTEYGFLPTGTNAQILAALRGGNPRKIQFFECMPECVNALGEFIDPWRTPYRIDTTNPEFPWAYSFGKDRQDDGGAPGSDDIASWQ